MTPEAEAVLADAPVAPASVLDLPEVPVATDPVIVIGPDPVTVPVPSPYPVVYYNPKIIDERFFVEGNPYAVRFTSGRFVARDAVEEKSVRAALAAYGRNKPDRWRGDDRNKEWVDRSTGFRTFNDAVKDDFEQYHHS
jgi:hypothetical protein